MRRAPETSPLLDIVNKEINALPHKAKDLCRIEQAETGRNGLKQDETGRNGTEWAL